MSGETVSYPIEVLLIVKNHKTGSIDQYRLFVQDEQYIAKSLAVELQKKNNEE